MAGHFRLNGGPKICNETLQKTKMDDSRTMVISNANGTRTTTAKAGFGNCPADYREINRRAYDALAKDYAARRLDDSWKDRRLIAPFVGLIRRQFLERHPRVLDIGCGNGLNMDMFVEQGFDVTGIDISAVMLKVAQHSCPSARLVHADFLTHRFAHESYHGIFAKAIIHLFPKEDAIRFLDKVHMTLKRKGVFYVTTTVESVQSEGVREKADYHGRVCRYRRTWRETELQSAVLKAGFKIGKTTYNQETTRGKKWFNIWALKQ